LCKYFAGTYATTACVLGLGYATVSYVTGEINNLYNVLLNYLAATYYTKTYIDSNYYTSSQITSNYYPKTYIDNNFYTKSYVNTNYFTGSYIAANYVNQTNLAVAYNIPVYTTTGAASISAAVQIFSQKINNVTMWTVNIPAISFTATSTNLLYITVPTTYANPTLQTKRGLYTLNGASIWTVGCYTVLAQSGQAFVIQMSTNSFGPFVNGTYYTIYDFTFTYISSP